MGPDEKKQSHYYSYSTYLHEIFKERVQKITINAGFSCPNRDGSKGVGGCIYCNNEAFSPSFASVKDSITSQIEKGINFFAHKYENQKYLAYFQSYTNTYGAIDKVKALYEESLSNQKIVGLVIGTRPDCVSDELLGYLEALCEKYYVMVEYGVESTSNTTLRKINRGHSYEDAVDAICKTARLGINTSAHLILGLPGESRELMLEHAKRISELPITTLKLHQLQVVRNTPLEKYYAEHPKELKLFSVDEYIELLTDFIADVSPSIVLERFVSQTPANLLIAPQWGLKNFEFSAKLEKRLKEKEIYQGDRYTKKE